MWQVGVVEEAAMDKRGRKIRLYFNSIAFASKNKSMGDILKYVRITQNLRGEYPCKFAH